MTPAIDPILQEAYDVLFRIVRALILGHDIRRNDIVAGRSVIRRRDPARYKALASRRAASGLADAECEQQSEAPLPAAPARVEDLEYPDGTEDTLP